MKITKQLINKFKNAEYTVKTDLQCKRGRATVTYANGWEWTINIVEPFKNKYCEYMLKPEITFAVPTSKNSGVIYKGIPDELSFVVEKLRNMCCVSDKELSEIEIQTKDMLLYYNQEMGIK